MHNSPALKAPIQHEIWKLKYRFNDEAGVEATWRRIAKALAAAEATPAEQDSWEQTFYEALEGFKFLPAGRIVAGAGTGRNVTLFNCFVMDTIPDSMDGIFSVLKESALTMQQGGGIGMDFSTLRPKGARVIGVGADASGPLSFMDVWDAMCRTIMSAGTRRGAMMGVLRCVAGDTIVSTVNGKFPIRDLVGKRPYVYCSDGKQVRVRQARAVFSTGMRKVIRVVMDNDESIVCTPDHPFLMRDGSYVEAAALTLGTSLVGFYKGIRRKAQKAVAINHKVVRIEDAGEVEVFDMTVPDFHNFVANGVFVHNCDHPDIEAFIEAKRDPAKLRMFNISVGITDNFMTAVGTNTDWPLVFEGTTYKVVSARKLWDRIIRGAYDCAEPGVIFIDRVNKANNLKYCETIAATNPCAEQPLPPHGACLLGSINLAAFIDAPFEKNASLDTRLLKQTVRTAVRMLDNVIDVSNYPLPGQRAEAIAKRRIGLGVTGLADALAMNCLHYGTGEARAKAAEWMRIIALEAYAISVDLAVEKSPFPLFDQSHGTQGFPGHQYREGCSIRNSHLISIAPTGTISLLAGNISSGIEPIYDFQYERKVLQADGTRSVEKVKDFAVRLYEKKMGTALEPHSLPAYFHARAHDLKPEDHLLMQAALQPFVDSSISKTVNCPEDMPFEDFQQLYMDAYTHKLKCCAAFRPNDITGSVLSTGTAAKPAATKPLELRSDNLATLGEQAREELIGLVHDIALGQAVPPALIAPRDHVLDGRTYKIRWQDHAVYVTINDSEDGAPFEIFINSKSLDHYAWSVGLTRMISAVFRRGGDISFVAKELKEIFDPRGGAWIKGRYVPSLLAAIGEVIERHMSLASEPEPMLAITDIERPVAFCPKCSSANVFFPKAKCLECRDCGWSNCE